MDPRFPFHQQTGIQSSGASPDEAPSRSEDVDPKLRIPGSACDQWGPGFPQQVQSASEFGIPVTYPESDFKTRSRRGMAFKDPDVPMTPEETHCMNRSSIQAGAERMQHMNQSRAPMSARIHDLDDSILPTESRQTNHLEGSGRSFAVAQNGEKEDSIDHANFCFQDRGQLEVSSGRRDSSNSIQAERSETNQQAHAVPKLQTSMKPIELLEIQHRESYDLAKTETGKPFLPSGPRQSSQTHIHPFKHPNEDNGIRNAERIEAWLRSQEPKSEILPLDYKRLDQPRQNAYTSHLTTRISELDTASISRNAIAPVFDHEVCDGKHQKRASISDPDQAMGNAFDNDTIFDAIPELRLQQSRTLQSPIICSLQNDAVQNTAVVASRNSQVTTELQDNCQLQVAPEKSQQVSDEIPFPSATEVLSNQVEVGKNKKNAMDTLQADTLWEIQDIIENGVARESSFRNEDLIGNFTTGIEDRPELSPFDNNTTLITDNHQISSQDEVVFNVADLNTALSRGRIGNLHTNLHTQNSVEDLQSNGVNRIETESERNTLGHQDLQDRNLIDLLNSVTQNTSGNTEEILQIPIQLEDGIVGEKATALRTANDEKVRVSAHEVTGNDRNGASQSQSEQIARESSIKQREIEISDAKAAFYNYDWTQLSPEHRRKRRKRILEAKRLPPSAVRIKVMSQNRDQVIAFGKVPEKAIVELSATYPRKGSSCWKNDGVRNRNVAQNNQDEIEIQLEFQLKENRKLSKQLSRYKSQHSALSKQLEDHQNRMRKVLAQAARLRIDNYRLMREVDVLHKRYNPNSSKSKKEA